MPELSVIELWPVRKKTPKSEKNKALQMVPKIQNSSLLKKSMMILIKFPQFGETFP
jgi:hypothetical protein